MKVYDPRIDHKLQFEPGTHVASPEHASHVESKNVALLAAYLDVQAGQTYSAVAWAFVMDAANLCDAPVAPPMNEKLAREILGEAVRRDGTLRLEPTRTSRDRKTIVFPLADGRAFLQLQFDLDEIEAIAWWMRNKAKKL